MTDRYQPMTMAESAELARQNETQDAVSRMGECAHVGACLRVMGMLCYGQVDYSDGYGEDAQQKRARAARWMGCAFCEEWDDAL